MGGGPGMEAPEARWLIRRPNISSNAAARLSLAVYLSDLCVMQWSGTKVRVNLLHAENQWSGRR